MAHVHPTVLVIDDEVEVRDALGDFFRRNGYAVGSAISGTTALALLEGGFRPCIIVMDLLMPDTNGFQFRTEQLRHPELATIPLIAHSGVGEIAHYARLLEATAYIQKPAELEAVLAVVLEHCLK